jgi:DNA-directed RNA polymerase specialized sigma24 family protein
VREIHEQIEKLPADAREVFDLIFYLGAERGDVARRLGVSVSTVTRRYREARLLLHDALGGDAGLT